MMHVFSQFAYPRIPRFSSCLPKKNISTPRKQSFAKSATAPILSPSSQAAESLLGTFQHFWRQDIQCVVIIVQNGINFQPACISYTVHQTSWCLGMLNGQNEVPFGSRFSNKNVSKAGTKEMDSFFNTAAEGHEGW